MDAVQKVQKVDVRSVCHPLIQITKNTAQGGPKEHPLHVNVWKVPELAAAMETVSRALKMDVTDAKVHL